MDDALPLHRIAADDAIQHAIRFSRYVFALATRGRGCKQLNWRRQAHFDTNFYFRMSPELWNICEICRKFGQFASVIQIIALATQGRRAEILLIERNDQRSLNRKDQSILGWRVRGYLVKAIPVRDKIVPPSLSYRLDRETPTTVRHHSCRSKTANFVVSDCVRAETGSRKAGAQTQRFTDYQL